MVRYCSWSHPAPGTSVQTTTSGFKTISKRVMTKDTATGCKEIKVLWIFDIDIKYDDPDNVIGDMCSWCRRVAEDGDGQEYDVYYEAQQTRKRQARKQYRIMKVLALVKGEELEETDSETSWMGNSDGDDDIDEVKGKQLDVGAGSQVGKEEANLVDEMVCDLGMKC